MLVTSNGGAAATGRPEALGLVRLRADGSIAWSRVYPMRGAAYTEVSVGVTGLGNVFLAVRAPCLATEPCPDFGGGPVPAPGVERGRTPIVLVKLSPAGAFTWQRAEAADFGLSAVAVDPNGSAALGLVRPALGAPYRPRIVKYRWDGARLWDLPAPDLDGDGTGWPTALAFDPAGNLAVGDGTAFGSLDPAGQVRWSAKLSSTPVSGRVVSIGTTAMGTVVVLVQHGQGAISWAGTQGATVAQPRDTALFLAVAEASGAPRFGRVIAADVRQPVGAAVDPAGRVAILTHGPTACSDRLERWNLAGDELWARLLDGCGTTGTMEWRGIVVDPVSHHVRAVGALQGAVSFGDGVSATSKGGSDDLLLDVLPWRGRPRSRPTSPATPRAFEPRRSHSRCKGTDALAPFTLWRRAARGPPRASGSSARSSWPVTAA